MSEEYTDYIFKALAIGDGGCGKTALCVQFAQGFFQENYKLTIGVEFFVKTIKVKNIETSQKAIKFCNTILTFILVAFAWLFFRVSCLSEAFVYIKRIFLCQGTNDDFLFYCAHIIFYIALVLFIDIPQYLSNDHTVMLKWPWQKQGLFCSVILILIILLAPGNEIPFIYFQF